MEKITKKIIYLLQVVIKFIVGFALFPLYFQLGYPHHVVNSYLFRHSWKYTKKQNFFVQKWSSYSISYCMYTCRKIRAFHELPYLLHVVLRSQKSCHVACLFLNQFSGHFRHEKGKLLSGMRSFFRKSFRAMFFV